MLIFIDLNFAHSNIFLFLLLKVMDDQPVHSSELVNQSFDYDSTETDDSKDELKEDDAKESLTGKKTVIRLFWD